jgi:hypothetical protein
MGLWPGDHALIARKGTNIPMQKNIHRPRQCGLLIALSGRMLSVPHNRASPIVRKQTRADFYR